MQCRNLALERSLITLGMLRRAFKNKPIIYLAQESAA